MSTSLLSTKLFFPSLRSNLVSRPRLVEKLDHGLRGSMTLISAPAGFGKTTLVSEWRTSHDAHDLPLAWLSLDEDDNDLRRFLIYMISAVAATRPGFGEIALAALQAQQVPPAHAILTGLINEINEGKEPLAFALDDYHLIQSQDVHEALSFLLEHLPAQMHMAILSRADPPLPLARLRARGQLTEIRAHDLRFSVDEAASFLNQVMGLDLTGEQVAALEERTEGWIAGLQLAALSMQGQEDVQGFISAFAGSHRYIVDYLAEEVLSRQPETVREFLLRTSILDRLTAPLCNVLTDRTDGQEILENLEHTNLFVIPLDDERCWYRYHHLFADVLRNRLGQTYPDAVSELHHRTADWCEQNQFIEQAIEHTFAIKDYDQVVRLLRRYYFQLMIPSNINLIWHWVRLFPEVVMRGNPWLSTYYAWFLWNRGNREAAESYLDSAQQALDHKVSTGQIPKDDSGFDSLPAEILSLRGVISASKGELERTIELANRALALAPKTAYTVRSMIYLNLYFVHRDQGDIENAIESCTKAIPLAKLGGEKGLIINAYHNLALMYKIQGQLHRAEQVYQEGLQFAEKEWQPDFPTCGLLLIHLAEIYYEWDDLEEAERLATRAVELSEPAYWWVAIYGRIFLSTLNRSKRNLPQVQKLLEEAESLLNQLHGAYFEDELRTYLTREQAMFGKFYEAERWVKTVKFESDSHLSFHQHVLAFQLAVVLLALGREDELLSIISKIEPICVAQGCIDWQIRALVLQATIWQKKNDNHRALTCLEKALSLAEKEGYIRVFLDQGERMTKLLQGAVRGMHSDYASRLLSVTSQASKKAPLAQPLIEPLSERELEILRLVAAGNSNQQIADALFLATGTVKKHLHNIFGKLGVQSRTQCLARARELGFLNA